MSMENEHFGPLEGGQDIYKIMIFWPWLKENCIERMMTKKELVGNKYNPFAGGDSSTIDSSGVACGGHRFYW